MEHKKDGHDPQMEEKNELLGGHSVEDQIKVLTRVVEALGDRLKTDSEQKARDKEVNEMLSVYQFWRRLFKGIGAFLIGGTGILALMQVFDKIMEWMKR